MASAVTAIATARKCERCQKDFLPGEWLCTDGFNHIVERREFFLAGAAPQQDGLDSQRKPLPKAGRVIVTGIPPSKSVQEMSVNGWTPGGDEQLYDDGGSVEFINGKFSTSCPEQQHWLAQKPAGYFCTEEEWRYEWSDDKEREQIRLDARRQELGKQQTEVEALRREVEQLRERQVE